MLLLADSDDLSARESCLGLSGLVDEQFKFDPTEEEGEVKVVIFDPVESGENEGVE